MFDLKQGQHYPDEPAIIGECKCCKGEIYEGEIVVESERELFCSKECLVDYLLEGVGWQFVIAGKEF